MKTNIILLALALLCTHIQAQDKIYFKKTVEPITADAKVGDWGAKPFVLYNVDTKLKYGFAYDDKFLYLCFQSEDKMNQMKIMQAGMNVMLNIKATKKATISIDYPLKKEISADTLQMLMGGGDRMQRSGGDSARMASRQRQIDTTRTHNLSQNQEMRVADRYDVQNVQQQESLTLNTAAMQDSNRRQRSDDRFKMQAKRMADFFLNNQQTMELSGFVHDNGTQAIGSTHGINVKMDWDSAGAMIYEIAIPWSEIFDNANFSPASIKEIALETTINVPEIPANFRQMQFVGGGGPPGEFGGGNRGQQSNAGRGNFDPTTYFVPATSKHKVYIEK